MNQTTRTGRLLATVALLAALTGCDGGPSGETTTPGTSTAPTATAEPAPATTEAAPTTSAPPTLSAAEQDQADVEATVLAYMAALNGVFQGADIEEIYPWSRGVAREQWVTQTLAYREQGLVLAGETPVEVREVEVNGDHADVLACVDYSGTTVTDADGQDITPERASGGELLADFVLEREDSAEHGWVVVDDVSRSEPCDG